LRVGGPSPLQLARRVQKNRIPERVRDDLF
jgi:hypothetical protein